MAPAPIDRSALSPGDEPPDEALVGLFLSVIARMRHHLSERSAEFDLSAPQAMALMKLVEPKSMRALADEMACDASKVTGIVDRLEARGLVERQVVPEDRRVKRLVLTEAGRRLQRRHHERLFDQMPLLHPLSERQRAQLARLLARIVEA